MSDSSSVISGAAQNGHACSQRLLARAGCRPSGAGSTGAGTRRARRRGRPQSIASARPSNSSGCVARPCEEVVRGRHLAPRRRSRRGCARPPRRSGTPFSCVPSRKRKRHGPAGAVLLARDELERHLLGGVRADLLLHAVVAVVELGAHALGLQPVDDLAEVVGVLLGDGDADDLHRRRATPGTRRRSARAGSRRTARSSRTARGGS